MQLKQFLPIIDWLGNYKSADLKGDLSAGITVGIMLIAQGMAYALLAGVHPIHGLYCALIPPIVYSILGTSRQLAVGPVALDSLLTAVAVGAIAGPNASEVEYLSLCVLLAFMVGCIQISMSFLRLGFLVRLLSKSVVSAFTSAAALVIIVSQLKHISGIKIQNSPYLHYTLYRYSQQWVEYSWIALVVGLTSIILLFLLKKVNLKLPPPLILVLIGIAVAFGFDLQKYNLDIVGDIPSGFPSFVLPEFSGEKMSLLTSSAFALAIISFMEAMVIGKALQSRSQTYRIDPNQELLAIGSGNLIGAFFQCFPTTGGFSRSAVNEESGARTNLATMISALFVGLTLLWLTQVFFHLPKAVLAAIIIVSVIKLFKYKEGIAFWKEDKSEGIIWLATFLGTLFLGIQEGLLTGVVLSLLRFLFQNMYPRHQTDIKSNTLIIQLEKQLFFGNAAYFQELVEEEIRKHARAIKIIQINCSHWSNMDSTALTLFNELTRELHKKKIKIECSAASPQLQQQINSYQETHKLKTIRFI